MIEWASPWVLWLLLPTWALAARPWITGSNRLALPVATRGQRRMSLRLLLAWLPPALRILGLSFLIIALARPRVAHHEHTVEQEGLDILLVIDTSDSMHTKDFATGVSRADRLEVAKGVVADFVVERENDRVGLVVFGEEAFTYVPLTLDHESLVSALDTVQVGIAGPRATAIGTAIAVATRRMEQVEAASKVIILLTDGQSNTGRYTPVEAAQMAAALDIKIYTVGVGKRGRSYGGWGGSGLDEQTLQEVSRLTRAQYFRATDTRTLQQIYETIDVLEPSPAEVIELTTYDERFQGWLWPGILMLLLGGLLGSTWLRRGP